MHAHEDERHRHPGQRLHQAPAQPPPLRLRRVMTASAGDAGAPASRQREPSRSQPPDADPPETVGDDDPDRPAPPDLHRPTGKTKKVIPGDKRQVSAYVSAAVADDARNAVLALMANPAGHRSLSALIENAIVREVQRLSEELYGGKPFPQRQVELPSGRPTGG